jgi:hypothetical protein
MIATYLKMLPLSLECDDTMWWRTDDFLVVLSFLASWVVHEHIVSHVVLLFLILLSCYLSALWSFDSLLGLFPHSLFLFSSFIHVEWVVSSYAKLLKFVMCLASSSIWIHPMTYLNWIESFLALSSFVIFVPSLEWLVTENTQRNVLIIISLCSFYEDIIAEGESSSYLSKVLALGHKLVLAKPWIVLQVGEVVSPPTPIFAYLSQDSHNEIYNIYDKYIHLQPPFESFFWNRKHEGDWRSRVW